MSKERIALRIPVLALLALAALLLATAATAETSVIRNGIDMWKTEGDGSTYTDFATQPIPAGFFCAGSKAFRGQIVWKGVPLKTRPAGALGEHDTVVHRLDDAVFDENGVASTRLQMRALSLVSVEPVRTSCGPFVVRAALHGEQPITKMQIFRERDSGGKFVSTLAPNVRLTFIPVGKSAHLRQTVTLDQNVEFLPTHPIMWSEHTGEESRILRQKGFVLVDTNGDADPDTYLPGTSNFFPGADQTALHELGLEGGALKAYSCYCGVDDPYGICNCHYQTGSCHCAAPN